MPIEIKKTKRCPFCAEVIQGAAVKCRFCGEFLYGDRTNSIPMPYQNDEEVDEENQSEEEDNVLMFARPSLWSMAGTLIRAGILLAVVIFVMFYPLEKLIDDMAGGQFTDRQVEAIGHYKNMAGAGVFILTILVVLFKAAWLKSIHYEITVDRIEWARGIFDRRIDNLDMFRIVDLKLHRSLLDCIVGVGSVTLFTKDKTDPEFQFEKVRYPRELYDILKKTSLDADRKQGVIHIE